MAFIVGFLFFVIGIYTGKAIGLWGKKRNQDRVYGEIISTSPSEASGEPNHYVNFATVEYEVDGIMYTTKSTYASSHFREYGIASVTYDKLDPRISTVGAGKSGWLIVLSFTIMGSLLMFLSL